MKNTLRYILLLICLLICFLPLSAQSYTYLPVAKDLNNSLERLIDFHADIDIRQDGTIRVTEYITLYAEGVDIRRGIVRNIPEVRVDKDGRTKKVSVKILDVKHNGKESPYHTEFAGDDIEVYFGTSEILLEYGIHQYELLYETRGHIGFFDEYDELYWNVTGNEWVFLIEHASATLHLPGSSEVINWSCYTGFEGLAEQKCSYNGDKAMPIFATTHTLAPSEGFTIAVAFPRDNVVRPTKQELFFINNSNWIYGGLIVLVSMIILGFFWSREGRDVKKMTPIVQFKPPYDWSPATVRYLYKQRFDNKIFAATLLQMAVKEGIKIEDNSKKRKKRYTLIAGDKDRLTGEESAIFRELFTSSDEREICSKNAKYLSKALNELKEDTISKTPIDKYYKDNAGFKASGCAIVVVLWLVFVFALFNFYSDETRSFYIIPLILIVLYQIFRTLMGARTKLGAQTMAELEGFRMYLGTAEQYWLEKLTPPDKTPEHFEEMLPYAVALDVENQWCEKFSDVLGDYILKWYTGENTSSGFTSVIAATTFINTFSTSVSESSRYSPPTYSSSGSSSGSSSWSSGSSGGGYSGGGGGGGGGRGW
jgi:Predicted membrane protein (DUF2207).